MDLVEALRYLAILLASILGGMILYSFFVWRRPKAFAPSSMLVFFLLISIVVGASVGGLDHIIRFQSSESRSGSITLSSSGQIRQGNINFAIYWDPTGTQLVDAVQWGILIPGQTGNVAFYVRNQDSFPLYCEIAASSWQPADASQYFLLTWNFGENPLDIGRSRKVALQLMVSPMITGITGFSFNIVITAQDEPFIGYTGYPDMEIRREFSWRQQSG